MVPFRWGWYLKDSRGTRLPVHSHVPPDRPLLVVLTAGAPFYKFRQPCVVKLCFPFIGKLTVKFCVSSIAYGSLVY